MHPLVMVMIALFVPLFLFMFLVGPFYAGLCVAIYLYFNGVTVDDVMQYAFDVDYVMGIHEGFYNSLMEQMDAGTINWSEFVLPIYGPTIAGALLSIYAIYKFISYLRNVFRLV